MWLGSDLAVAVVWAGTCSSDLTCSLGNSICQRCSSKKAKKNKNKKPPQNLVVPNLIWQQNFLFNFPDLETGTLRHRSQFETSC